MTSKRRDERSRRWWCRPTGTAVLASMAAAQPARADEPPATPAFGIDGASRIDTAAEASGGAPALAATAAPDTAKQTPTCQDELEEAEHLLGQGQRHSAFQHYESCARPQSCAIAPFCRQRIEQLYAPQSAPATVVLSCQRQAEFVPCDVGIVRIHGDGEREHLGTSKVGVSLHLNVGNYVAVGRSKWGTVTQPFTVSEGAPEVVTLRFLAKAARASASEPKLVRALATYTPGEVARKPESRPSSEAPNASERSLPPSWLLPATIGTAAAAAASFVMAGVVNNKAEKRQTQLLQECPPADGYQPTCTSQTNAATAAQLASDGRSLLRQRDAFLIVGGTTSVLALGGLVTYLLLDQEPTEQGAAAGCSTSGCAVTFSAVF